MPIVNTSPPTPLNLTSYRASTAHNNRAESDGGNVIRQAMAVTATLWPILFAAAFGPMLKAVALYRAERGVKLGVSISANR